MRRTWIAVSLVVAVVMIVALPAWARGGGGSTISLVIPTSGLASTTSGTASPSFGQQVTFAESTTATSTPWVETKCYQSGQLVYDAWAGFFASYSGSQMFTLGPTQLWTGGAANCTADLVGYSKTGKATTLASTSFSVSG
jgi:hypothetical protein